LSGNSFPTPIARLANYHNWVTPKDCDRHPGQPTRENLTYGSLPASAWQVISVTGRKAIRAKHWGKTGGRAAREAAEVARPLQSPQCHPRAFRPGGRSGARAGVRWPAAELQTPASPLLSAERTLNPRCGSAWKSSDPEIRARPQTPEHSGSSRSVFHLGFLELFAYEKVGCWVLWWLGETAH